MTHLKKYFAVLVAITMLVTAMMPAFAADTFKYSGEATKLNAIGLYKGTSTTEFVPDLGAALDRQTGVVMLLRMFSLEEKALAMADADVTEALKGFTDASTLADFAKKPVAYATANKLVMGTSATTFSPKTVLSGKAYATLLLRQMGFTVDAAGFANAAKTLKEKGGLSEEQATLYNSDKGLIKDDLVGISYGALMATNSAGKKVIEDLILSGVVDETKAKDIYVMPAIIKTLTAASGTLTAVFNKAPEAVPAKADFTITEAIDGAAATTVTATNCTWAAATLTATITIPTVSAGAAEKKVVYTAKYKETAVATAAEIKITTGLTVDEANIKSNFSKIQFTVPFSSEVNKDTVNTTNVTVKSTANVAKTVAQVDVDSTEKIATVTLATALDQSTDVVVKFENIEAKGDATKKITSWSKTITVSDVIAPTVTVTATSSKTLKLKFSEAMTGITENAVTNWTGITIDGASAAGKLVKLANDYNAYTLTLNSVLAAGDHTVIVKDFTDVSLLKVASTSTAIKVEADTTAPAIVADTGVTVVDKGLLRITFTEPIDPSVGTMVINEGTYSIADTARVVFKDSNIIELTLNSANYLDTNSTITEDISMTGIKDFAGNTVVAGTKFTFKAPVDQTLPTATCTLNDDNTITVAFSKNVINDNTTNASNLLANYVLKDADGLVSGSISSVVLDTTSPKSKVKVTCSTLAAVGGVNPTAYTLTVKNVKDFSILGNTMTTQTFSFTTKDTKRPSIAAGPTLTDGTTTNAHKVKISFDEAMDPATLANEDLYVYTHSAVATALSAVTDATISVASDNKSVEITIPTANDTGDAITCMALKDVAGNVLSATYYSLPQTVGSKVAKAAGNVSIQLKSPTSIEIYSLGTWKFNPVVPSNSIKILYTNGTEKQLPSTVCGVYTTLPVITGNAVVNSDLNKITVTLSSEVFSDGTVKSSDGKSVGVLGSAYKIAVYTTATAAFGQTAADSGLQDYMGSLVTINDSAAVVPTDYTKPVASVKVGTVASDTAANSITIKFSETVKCSAANFIADLEIKDKDGNTITIPTPTLSTDALKFYDEQKNLITTVANTATTGFMFAELTSNSLLAASANNFTVYLKSNNVVDRAPTAVAVAATSTAPATPATPNITSGLATTTFTVY